MSQWLEGTPGLFDARFAAEFSAEMAETSQDLELKLNRKPLAVDRAMMIGNGTLTITQAPKLALRSIWTMEDPASLTREQRQSNDRILASVIKGAKRGQNDAEIVRGLDVICITFSCETEFKTDKGARIVFTDFIEYFPSLRETRWARQPDDADHLSGLSNHQKLNVFKGDTQHALTTVDTPSWIAALRDALPAPQDLRPKINWVMDNPKKASNLYIPIAHDTILKIDSIKRYDYSAFTDKSCNHSNTACILETSEGAFWVFDSRNAPAELDWLHCFHTGHRKVTKFKTLNEAVRSISDNPVAPQLCDRINKQEKTDFKPSQTFLSRLGFK